MVVTHQLDSDLDWNTFQLGDITFGSTGISIPAGRLSFSTRLDLAATDGIYLDVSASFDPTTGLATWIFQSIDPVTMDVSTDPTKGFLPPDVAGNVGKASLAFTVSPKTGLPTGTPLDATADIVFDNNPTISTAPISNTIDDDAPSSTVQPLPAQTAKANITVKWSGSDGAGSGMAA